MTQLKVKRADAWIQQGAPKEALSFLEASVDKLSKQAIKEERIYKESDMNQEELLAEDTNKKKVEETEEEKVEETPAVVTEEDVTTGIPAKSPSMNDSVPATTDTPTTPGTPATPATTPSGENQLMKAFEEKIASAIVTAIKEYHESVIAPEFAARSAEKAEATVSKSVSPYAIVENVFAGASDFMPSAAVSALLKKEFNVTQTPAVDEKTISKEALDTSETKVTSQKVTKGIGNNGGNLLESFE